MDKKKMAIDAVVMWVDGSDPEWLKEKNRYSPVKIDDSNKVNRYRDWNLMKYWFRTLETNCPWIRKVFFVTWGHIPSFLNTNNKKLVVVKHDDFIPKQYLPTFSSHTIELNLHRIPGLSECFLLFNDDMFIVRPLNQNHFFFRGLPRLCYSEAPLLMKLDSEVWEWARFNGVSVINKHFSKRMMFKKHPSKVISFSYSLKNNIRNFILMFLCRHFTGLASRHSINAHKKSTFKAVWNMEYELLNNTSLHKFRNKADVNQWVMMFWNIAGGNFYPIKESLYVADATDKTVNEFCSIITNRSKDVICINDPLKDVDFERLSAKLINAFENAYPNKSCFEK